MRTCFLPSLSRAEDSLLTDFPVNSRKSDIENERLPPELINPEDANPMFSNPSTPGAESSTYPFPQPNHYGTPARQGSSNGGAGSEQPFRPKHLRQQSLGTTSTSPSNRRRSIESTISMIREAAAGGEDDDPELQHLADQLSNVSAPKPKSPTSSRWHGRGPSI